MFFPLMSILEGGVRFPVDPFLLRTLRFYGLSPDQCLPNFYKVMSYVARLNQIYGLSLTHHNINFMYCVWGSLRLEYYPQTCSTMVQLISCLPNSNRNSAGELVKVSGNWLNGELIFSFPISQHHYHLLPPLNLLIHLNSTDRHRYTVNLLLLLLFTHLFITHYYYYTFFINL